MPLRSRNSDAYLQNLQCSKPKLMYCPYKYYTPSHILGQYSWTYCSKYGLLGDSSISQTANPGVLSWRNRRFSKSLKPSSATKTVRFNVDGGKEAYNLVAVWNSDGTPLINSKAAAGIVCLQSTDGNFYILSRSDQCRYNVAVDFLNRCGKNVVVATTVATDFCDSGVKKVVLVDPSPLFYRKVSCIEKDNDCCNKTNIYCASGPFDGLVSTLKNDDSSSDSSSSCSDDCCSSNSDCEWSEGCKSDKSC